MVKYSLIKSNPRISELGSVVTYGIKVTEDDREYYIDDITDNRLRLEKLITDCNNLKLEPVHLREVIEDFLKKLIDFF